MMQLFSPARIITVAVAMLVVLFAFGWATRHDPAEKPLIQILGGGFIFNYRIADVRYGFTAVVAKPLESGSIIEAAFENPAGGEPLVVRERVSPMTNRYALESPPVRGVEAGKPYRVSIRVLDRLERDVLWTSTLDIKSQISDDVVPDEPLTIGPGYHRPLKRG